jgi:uncharacterized membrane protein YgaE (UPF0421/DUF939 family)
MYLRRGTSKRTELWMIGSSKHGGVQSPTRRTATTRQRFDSMSVFHAALVAAAATATYAAVAQGLSTVISFDDGTARLGGMWAAISTLFCFRDSYADSAKYALSRMSATLTSFILCTVYVLLFPFSVWGIGVVVFVGAVTLTALRRPDDIITTSITTLVVLVVAGLATHDRWAQPLLRLLDTAVGVVIGLAAAVLATRVETRLDLDRPSTTGRR